jgi:hypothetical protein
MIRQLITLPLRTTRRGAELLLDGASRALSLALELAGRSGGEPAGGSPGQPDSAPAPNRQSSKADSQNGSGETPSATGQQSPTEAPIRPTAPPAELTEPPEPPEPVHIEDEPELVAESADPGAADGAGAQLTVDEPWPGYQQLNADEIIDRLSTANPAELAVMELYEATHKRRRTVLSALQRQLNE